MRAYAGIGLLVLGVLAHRPAQGQKVPPPALSGTVKTLRGEPAAGMRIRVGLWPEIWTDSLGRYSFESLAAGRWRFAVGCPGPGYWNVQPLLIRDVVLAPGAQVIRDEIVDPRHCRNTIPDTLHGLFRGYWSVGFEESGFVPCPGSTGTSMVNPKLNWTGIWAVWAPSVRANWPEPPPQADTSGYGNRYYVEARGYLHGPGDFGHMSVAAFQLEIESLLVVKTPRAGDCR
jgi:hypothetical protein